MGGDLYCGRGSIALALRAFNRIKDQSLLTQNEASAVRVRSMCRSTRNFESIGVCGGGETGNLLSRDETFGIQIHQVRFTYRANHVYIKQN